MSSIMESTLLHTLSLFLFLGLCLLPTTSGVPTSSIVGAVKSLSNSGFNSMALTLQFANATLLPPNTRTIFAPPDTAFRKLGQPPLSLLHFHFSPLSISLKNLTFSSRIPSFFANHSLFLTSFPQHGQFSLNGVNVSASPLFHDAFLLVFGTQGFFDPNFVKDNGFTCSGGRKLKYTASEVLKIRGFSIMAAFLDLQIGEFTSNTPITIFAPPDAALKGSVRNFAGFRTVLERHLVPCRISGRDLESLDGGMVLPTFLEGFSLELNKSESELRIEGVNVTDVDMFKNEWMVVHGIQESFVVEDPPLEGRDFAKSSSQRIRVIELLYGIMVFAFVLLLW